MVVRFSAFLYRPLAPSVLFASLACLLLLLLHLLLRSRRTVAHAADKLYSVSMRAARLVQFRVVLLVACCCLLSRMCCAVLSRHDTEHSEDNNLDDDEHSNLRSTRKLVRSDLDPEPDVWIVELQPGSTTTTTRRGIASTASHLARFGGGQVGFVYGAALNGFVYHGSNIEGLLQNPNVRSITRDSIVTATAGGQVLPTGVMRIFADTKNSSVQASASCFCDAVVAVMDTGVDFTHPDLRVNTSMSIDCTRGTEDKPKCVRGEGNDDHGHGTHVSGTIAAVRNDRGVVGVCPGAEIWSIKVLDSTASGYWSWFLKGLDWVLTSGSNVDVINMSLGSYGCSTSICQAISMAKQAGIGVVVSAGNDDAPASLYTPACCPDVLSKFIFAKLAAFLTRQRMTLTTIPYILTCLQLFLR